MEPFLQAILYPLLHLHHRYHALDLSANEGARNRLEARSRRTRRLAVALAVCHAHLRGQEPMVFLHGLSSALLALLRLARLISFTVGLGLLSNSRIHLRLAAAPSSPTNERPHRH